MEKIKTLKALFIEKDNLDKTNIEEYVNNAEQINKRIRNIVFDEKSALMKPIYIKSRRSYRTESKIKPIGNNSGVPFDRINKFLKEDEFVVLKWVITPWKNIFMTTYSTFIEHDINTGGAHSTRIKSLDIRLSDEYIKIISCMWISGGVAGVIPKHTLTARHSIDTDADFEFLPTWNIQQIDITNKTLIYNVDCKSQFDHMKNIYRILYIIKSLQ